MAAIETKLAGLRRRAASNRVEVEHLTDLAVLGDPAAVPVIRDLQRRYQWSASGEQDDGRVAPLGRWADVVCICLEGGPEALVAHARGEVPDAFHFAVGVLADLRSSSAADALAELARDVEPRLPERLADAVPLAAATNSVLSFDTAPAVPAATAQTLRRFLHSVLRQRWNEAQRATVVCALRGVGDEESIHVIEQMPPFAAPWLGLERLAINAIRKRRRSSSDG